MVLTPKTRNFIHLNEGFRCKVCKEKNPPASKTCRNHCHKCLHSQHVDKLVPGDRASGCEGTMQPMLIEQKGKKGYQIIHLCQKCGAKTLNKIADDDDIEMVIKIMKKQNINTPSDARQF